MRHLATGLSDASLWAPIDEAGAQVAPLEERARRIAQRYERVGPDVAEQVPESLRRHKGIFVVAVNGRPLATAHGHGDWVRALDLP